MSNDTLLRVVRVRCIRLPSDPLRVVGIDDWAWRRNHRYASIVCNLERRRARVAAYEASPEARARERIFKLTTLGYSRRLSAAEKAALESLESLYPRLPPHPDHPGASSFAKFGEALKRLKEELTSMKMASSPRAPCFAEIRGCEARTRRWLSRVPGLSPPLDVRAYQIGCVVGQLLLPCLDVAKLDRDVLTSNIFPTVEAFFRTTPSSRKPSRMFRSTSSGSVAL